MMNDKNLIELFDEIVFMNNQFDRDDYLQVDMYDDLGEVTYGLRVFDAEDNLLFEGYNNAIGTLSHYINKQYIDYIKLIDKVKNI